MPGVILCPACGTARLVPLHFPVYRLEQAAEAIVRPVAKCSGCGQRIFAPPRRRKARADSKLTSNSGVRL